MTPFPCFTYTPARCPLCNRPASSVLEWLPGSVRLNFDEKTGTYDHAGETEIAWDYSEPVIPEGKPGEAADCGGIPWDAETGDEASRAKRLLTCDNDHDWIASESDATRPDPPARVPCGPRRGHAGGVRAPLDGSNE